MVMIENLVQINKLSVVIPVLNEQDNIVALINEINTVLKPVIESEIICVDDGSVDATLDKLRALKAQYPQLRIVRHARRCGQSTAIRTGVRYARFDWILTLDGDGQNDPADIPAFLSALTEGVELVIGNRRASRRDVWIKRISSVIANEIRSRILQDHTPDSGCGLKLFLRSAFLDLPYFDHMHRFLPALFKRRGSKIISVPVGHRARKHGASNYGTFDRLVYGIIDLMGVAWLQRRAKVPIVTEEN
jgi:dolichol-phosphate mannosyltransferase